MRERGRSGMRHMSELLTAAGLTSVHDASANRDRILAFEDAKANGELRHRAAFLAAAGDTFAGFKAAGLTYNFGDEFLRCTGVKFVADGSASERTMRMSTPYVGTDDYGILTMTQQELDEAVEDAHAHDFRIGIHANGDVTIDMVLKAYEKAMAKHPRADVRHRIEHCSLVNPDLLQRIKAGGVIPTPFWTYVYYHGEKWVRVRRGQDALDVRAQVVPRRGHPRAWRVRLQPRPVRADDGAAEPGHAQGHQGSGVGRQPAGHGGRGFAASPRSTAPTPRTRSW